MEDHEPVRTPEAHSGEDGLKHGESGDMRTTGILTLVGVGTTLQQAFTSSASGFAGNPLLLFIGIAGLGSLAALSERWRTQSQAPSRREFRSPLSSDGPQ